MAQSDQSNVRLTDLRIRDLRGFPVPWIPIELFEMGLSWRALIVYAGLTYYTCGAQTCDIAIKRMAKLIDASESTVKRGLKELKEKEAILVESRFKAATSHRPEGKREQLSNEYSMLQLGRRRKKL